MSALLDQAEPEQLHNHALPDDLPVGEYLLWQGAPTIRSTALHVFHVRKVAIYFVALMLWRFADRFYSGASALDATIFALWFLPVAAAGLALLTALAALTAKTTIYTITSKRVVLRIGIALSMTVNLPFKVVEAAGLKLFEDGSGDIALQLQPDNKAAYAVLWPHARRWHLKHPQPTLRSIPSARDVADILSEALANIAPAAATHSTGPIGGRAGEPAQTPDTAYPAAAE
jgi:hypothetical protein